MSFLEELKRRRVYRIAALYTVLAWAIIQAADIVLPTFNAPQWINQTLILGLLAGLPVVLFLAWSFQITDEGVQKTQPLGEHETVNMRKRDYFFGVVVTALIGLLVVQQIALLNRIPDTIESIATLDANEQLIEGMQHLLDQNDVVGAYILGMEANAQISTSAAVQQIWESFTAISQVITEPANATAFLRDFRNSNADWLNLGTTPLTNFPLPETYFNLKFEHEGHATSEHVVGSPHATFGNIRANQPPRAFKLPPIDTPPDMVFVQQNATPPAINGFQLRLAVLGDFYIDRHEVTNREFKEFVDRGGYENDAHWENLLFEDGASQISKAEALAQFVDSTGRPGPANWELGTYPSGTADYPVTGVSWYEAVAYARFRGKELPTAYHWARAAFSHGRWNAPMVQTAVWQGSELSEVGASQSKGPHGAEDMVGNVREWIWNNVGENKAAFGGSWSDPEYMSVSPFSLPPMTRDAFTGFRLVTYLNPNGVREVLFQPIQADTADYISANPVSDEVYEVLKSTYRYSSENLNPITEWVREGDAGWSLEKVNLNTDYNDGQFAVYIMRPKGTEPVEAVIHFTNLGPFYRDLPSETFNFEDWDFIVSSGRAFVFPVYWGSFERYAGLYELDQSSVELEDLARQLTHRWYSDLGRTLDYLESRSDLISEGFDYLGYSYGASVATPLLALEPRLKSAVLIMGGFPYLRLPPDIDVLNFVTRISQPTLMLGGRYDALIPLESQQIPFFNLLGTPDTDKRHLVYDVGHALPPRADLVRETIDWFDRY